MSEPVTVQVDVYSDVVCPWCYIGKRRFDRAVAEVSPEIDVRITYRPYQLDPRAPVGAPTPVVDAYAKKFGGPDQAAAIIERVTTIADGEGLGFRMDKALRANTFDAHRLIWWAEVGGPVRRSTGEPIPQHEVKERLLAAYFLHGSDVGDHDALAAALEDLDADPDRTRSFLASDEGADEVAALLGRAHELGISGVPAYVIDDAWNIPGAQDTEVFVQVLRRLAERRRADAATADDTEGGVTCDDDACDV